MTYKKKKKATNHKLLKSIDASIERFNAYDAWLKRQPKAPTPFYTWEVGRYTAKLQDEDDKHVTRLETTMSAAVEPCYQFYRLILTNSLGQRVFAGRFTQDEKGFLYLQGNLKDNAGKSTLPNGVERVVGSFEEFANAYRQSQHSPAKIEQQRKVSTGEIIHLDIDSALPMAV